MVGNCFTKLSFTKVIIVFYVSTTICKAFKIMDAVRCTHQTIFVVVFRLTVNLE